MALLSETTIAILLGIGFGTGARIYMLRTDYRSYPTYLHGRIIHILAGFIASALGAVLLPAIVNQDYTAVTFFTVAASQFRDVRNMERNTLLNLDENEIVPRGKTYIEGIALVFEGRNYLVILTAMLTTFSAYYISYWAGLIGGCLGIFLCSRLMSGMKIRDIADIKIVQPHFEDAGLYVGDVYIMNIGLPERQKEILTYGMGFMLIPHNLNGKVNLANFGQRQAILHDLYMGLGIYRDSGTPALTPLAKRNMDTGALAVFMLPRDHDEEWARFVIGNVPVLESAYRYMSSKKKNRLENQGE